MRTWVICALTVVLIPLSEAAPPRTATVRDWTFKDFQDGSAGGQTTNGSGSTLVVYCSAAQQCLIFLTTDSGCEEGSKHDVLVNSDSGAMAAQAGCSSLSTPDAKQRFALNFDDFDALLKIILKDHTVGFAIALQSGQFKVVRFSLEGSNEVLAAVAQTVKGLQKPAALKDQTL